MFYLGNFRQERVDMQFEGLQKNMFRLKTPLELTCQLLRAVTSSVLYGVWRHLCQSRKEVVLLKRQLLVIILPSHGLGPDSWVPYIKGVVLSFPSQQRKVREGHVLVVCRQACSENHEQKWERSMVCDCLLLCVPARGDGDVNLYISFLSFHCAVSTSEGRRAAALASPLPLCLSLG